MCFKASGSLTVEAAVALPVIMVCIALLITPFNVMESWAKEQTAIEEAGMTLSRTGYLYYDSDDSEESEIVKLNGICSHVSPFTLLGRKGLYQTTLSSRRKWIGKTGSGGDTSASEGESVLVYVSTYSVCYHLDPHCSYLDVKVKEIEESETEGMRICEYCKNKEKEGYYSAQYTDVYHVNKSCPALVRHVRAVTKTEAGDMKLCSKCGKKQ